jgi:hypothetical protein
LLTTRTSSIRQPPGPPLTHVVCTLAPLPASALLAARAPATSVEAEHAGGLAVDVTGLAWRQALHHIVWSAVQQPDGGPYPPDAAHGGT